MPTPPRVAPLTGEAGTLLGEAADNVNRLLDKRAGRKAAAAAAAAAPGRGARGARDSIGIAEPSSSFVVQPRERGAAGAGSAANKAAATAHNALLLARASMASDRGRMRAVDAAADADAERRLGAWNAPASDRRAAAAGVCGARATTTGRELDDSETAAVAALPIMEANAAAVAAAAAAKAREGVAIEPEADGGGDDDEWEDIDPGADVYDADVYADVDSDVDDDDGDDETTGSASKPATTARRLTTE